MVEIFQALNISLLCLLGATTLLLAYVLITRIITPLRKLNYYKAQGVVFPPGFKFFWGHIPFLEEYQMRHGLESIIDYFCDQIRENPDHQIYGYFHGPICCILIADPEIAFNFTKREHKRSWF